MKTGLAKLVLVLSSLLAVHPAHADIDEEKLCASTWAEHRELFKSWVVAKIHVEVQNKLVELYDRAGIKIQPTDVVFRIEAKDEASYVTLKMSNILVNSGDRHDGFNLRDSAMTFLAMRHSIPYTNSIGEISAVDCGLYIDNFSQIDLGWKDELFNAKTKIRVAEVATRVHVPPMQRVPIQ